MLTVANKMRGVTLVELVIAMVIMGILLAMGARSFGTWIQNQQTRVATESILNGLQLARGEAVKRNENAIFFLCGNMATATADSSWDVLVVSAAGVANPCAVASAATGLDRVQQRSGQEGSSNALVASSAVTNAVAFNGAGRVDVATMPAGYTQPITEVDVSNPKGDRSLSIMVSPGGNLRMCDASLPVNTGPLACK